jgi:hypothetical protein
MRQVQATRFVNANPKLKILVDIHDRPDAPNAKIHFVDGSDQNFDTKELKADEILFTIHLKAMNLDATYEMEGKNIDEL